MLILSLICSVISLGCYVVVLVHAFNNSTTEGFLSLCVPCYSLYYMLTKYEGENKALVIAGAIGGSVAARVLAAMADTGSY